MSTTTKTGGNRQHNNSTDLRTIVDQRKQKEIKMLTEGKHQKMLSVWDQMAVHDSELYMQEMEQERIR